MPCRIILGLVRLQRSPSFFLQRNFLSLTSITIPLTMSNLVVSSCCQTTKQRPRRHRYWQECIPVECVPSTAVAVSGSGGGRGVCPGDVCVSGGVSQHMQWGRQPPWTEFLTHAYENITFPQLLLRTVITQMGICVFISACVQCEHLHTILYNPIFVAGTVT